MTLTDSLVRVQSFAERTSREDREHARIRQVVIDPEPLFPLRDDTPLAKRREML